MTLHTCLLCKFAGVNSISHAVCHNQSNNSLIFRSDLVMHRTFYFYSCYNLLRSVLLFLNYGYAQLLIVSPGFLFKVRSAC